MLHSNNFMKASLDTICQPPSSLAPTFSLTPLSISYNFCLKLICNLLISWKLMVVWLCRLESIIWIQLDLSRTKTILILFITKIYIEFKVLQIKQNSKFCRLCCILKVFQFIFSHGTIYTRVAKWYNNIQHYGSLLDNKNLYTSFYFRRKIC